MQKITYSSTESEKDIHSNEIVTENLDFLLHAASRHMTRLFKTHLDEFDLTYTQYLVLIHLKMDYPLSVDKIGEKLHLDSGTLTPLLKRLEAKNYIHRHRSSQDERRLEVVLTKSGKSLQTKLFDLNHKIYESLALGSSVEMINKLLGKLIHLFQGNTAKIS